ncbi:hypothetical protein SAMN06295967_10531 [Belliella buryatensis]|uniref:Uncharacterized protein n=1 Tax=Belliella buryatensis TaxID=1500549 RepID=A0A239CG39_9BACT|nr:hypothetical protein [Belliella buryatensis]SNS19196.1 hypothetical protein SAMN06295967_10531 [Belliella buryatensis]
MERDKLIHVPLLKKKWNIFAYILFALPIPVLIVLFFIDVKLSSDGVADLVYSFWAMGASIMILTEENKEDERLKHFRLQAFQTGFYWLIWGLAVLIVVHLVGNVGGLPISGPKISAPLVMFLLSFYVLAALKYQVWKSNKVDEQSSK